MTTNSEIRSTETTVERPKDALAAAAIVARHVALRDVYIRKVSAEIHQRPQLLLAREFDWVVSSAAHEFEYREVDHFVDVMISLRVAAIARDDEAASSTARSILQTDVSVVDIEVVVALEYQLTTTTPPPIEIRDELFSGFAEINGVYNAWPYLREQVQSATVRMGLPGVVLPVFRVETKRGPEVKDNSEEVSNSE